MTPEELTAIRERAQQTGYAPGKDDIFALLREVDRLTAQRKQILDGLDRDRPFQVRTAYGEGQTDGYALAEEVVREALNIPTTKKETK